MAKTKRIRSKACSRCAATSAVLYRVRIENDGDWIFVCSPCLYEVKPGNPHYQYGGTWKSKKRH
jgi:alpha-D-ribose 1-methylphosphonate 5-phosphate C-P lyase